MEKYNVFEIIVMAFNAWRTQKQCPSPLLSEHASATLKNTVREG